MHRIVRILTCLLLVSMSFCSAAGDPLPSWNEGCVKKRLIAFVEESSDPKSQRFIPIESRIATFDQDGTLWVEKPFYAQLAFSLDTVADHPEWNENWTLQDIEKVINAAHSGMSVTEFQQKVQNWLATAKHPRFKRPYTELVYQPMLELIDYLRKNDYKIYITSGGGQEFIRVYSEKVYGIPIDRVIGTAGKLQYTKVNSKPELMKLPELLFLDDKSGKPEAIQLFIGKRPVAAFGNSDGDREMLEWSQTLNNSLQLLIHHDDAEREYAYDTDSKIGRFSTALKEEALKNNWLIISMKKDWNRIFPK
ncbi:MAG: haloacid dehalogenase-like hydrolase [Chlamydiia bacterium]|nr:haloacid dehalogenase-like hydrolase [Chlamydiia bacterium]